jgi:hypothetical protein
MTLLVARSDIKVQEAALMAPRGKPGLFKIQLSGQNHVEGNHTRGALHQ